MRAPGSTWRLAACPSLPRPTQHSAWGHRTHRAHGDTPPWRSQQGPSCRPHTSVACTPGGAVLPTRSLWKTLLSTHTRAHSHTHTHKCTHAFMCAYTHSHTCAKCRDVRGQTHTHVHTCTHVQAHTYTCMCAHSATRTHTGTFTHTAAQTRPGLCGLILPSDPAASDPSGE